MSSRRASHDQRSRGDSSARRQVFRSVRRHLDTVRRIATLLALACAATGCSALGLDGGTSERSRLRANRARWEQQGIAAYRFTYHRGCFCPSVEPIAIQVAGTAVVEAAFAYSDEPVPFHLGDLPTVEGLFAIVEQAIAQRVDLLEVDYHPVLGYPTRVAIDYGFNMADDEVVHYASGLVPIVE